MEQLGGAACTPPWRTGREQGREAQQHTHLGALAGRRGALLGVATQRGRLPFVYFLLLLG